MTICFKIDVGDQHIQVLVEEFGPALAAAGVDTESLCPAWARFKVLLYNRYFPFNVGGLT